MNPTASPVPSTTWRAFQSREYAAMWAGAFVSNVGTWLERISLGVYVAELTGSSGWSGVSAALLFLPALVTAPVGGALADRFGRRRYLLVITSLQTVIAALLTALAAVNLLTLPTVMVLMTLIGCLGTMMGPAFSALLTELVPEEAMGSAMFLNSGQFNLARVVGPVLAAGVLTAGGVTWAFALNTVSFLAVLGALVRTRPPEHPRPLVRVSILRSSLEGIRAIRNDPGITSALEVTLATALLISPFVGLIPIFALRELKSDSAGASLLVTAQGIGAVLSAVASSAYVGIFGFRRWLSGAALLLMPVSVCYWLSPTLSSAFVFMVLTGAAYLALMSGCSTICLTRAPRSMKARVASVFTGSLDFTYGIGVVGLGALGDVIGLRAACVGAVAVFGIFLVWVHRRSRPMLGALDFPPTPEAPPGTVVLAEEAP